MSPEAAADMAYFCKGQHQAETRICMLAVKMAGKLGMIEWNVGQRWKEVKRFSKFLFVQNVG